MITVHDELLFEALEGGRVASQSWSGGHGARLHARRALTMDVGIGRNWTEAKP